MYTATQLLGICYIPIVDIVVRSIIAMSLQRICNISVVMSLQCQTGYAPLISLWWTMCCIGLVGVIGCRTTIHEKETTFLNICSGCAILGIITRRAPRCCLLCFTTSFWRSERIANQLLTGPWHMVKLPSSPIGESYICFLQCHILTVT